MDGFEDIQLETNRLILKRAYYKLHAEEINAVVCDTVETLEPFLIWAKQKPTVKETSDGLIRVTSSTRDFSFRVYLKESSNVLIGMCGIKSLGENRYELGYWCHKSYTQKGYTREAADRVLNFARNVLHANIVMLYTMKRNNASRNLAKKLGFLLSGEELSKSEQRPDWGEYFMLQFEKQFSQLNIE